MKKRIKYLIFILLFIPVFVLADGGEPVFLGYFNGYVSDSAGASLYTYDEDDEKYIKTDYVLPYNTTLTIEDENKISDELSYGLVKKTSLSSNILKMLGEEETTTNDDDEDEDEDDSEGESYYINLSKVTPVKEKFTIVDWIKDNGTENLEYVERDYKIIIFEDGFNIYNGPSTKYSLVKSDFKSNTIFNVKYELEGWIYVEGNGVSGWSNEENYGNGYKESLWILDGSEIFNSIKKDKSNVVIPNDTIIDEYFYYSPDNDDNDEMYIVKYENQICYLVKNKAAESYDSTTEMISLKKMDIYDKISGEKQITLDKNKTFKILYETGGFDWLYIDYGNGKGWFKNNDSYASNNKKSFIVGEPVNIYNELGGKKTSSLPAGTIIEKSYDYYYENNKDDAWWVYFKYNNSYVWAKQDELSFELDPDDYEDYNIAVDVKLYDKPLGKQGNATIKKGSKIVVKYEYYYYDEDEDDSYSWYYVVNGIDKGWINSKENYVLKVDEKTGEEKEVPVELKKIEKSEIISSNEPNEVSSKKKLSQKEIIYISVLCAIILALLIIVIILLVNKKKNNSNNEIKEEKQNE